MQSKPQVLSQSLQWRNWGAGLGAIAPPLRKKQPFLEEYKDKIILFVLPYFNFFPAIE